MLHAMFHESQVAICPASAVMEYAASFFIAKNSARPMNEVKHQLTITLRWHRKTRSAEQPILSDTFVTVESYIACLT